MITFKPIVVSSNRRKDGTYPVKIRVTFKGKYRKLPTTLVCTSSDLTRSLRIKNATILDKADILIRQMREAVSDLSPFDLDVRDVDWVVSVIRDKLTTESFHLDFFEWADSYLTSKTPQTRAVYVTALNAFERFLGKREIDINSISKGMILDFVASVDASPMMRYNHRTKTVNGVKGERIPRAASMRYVSHLATIHNAAKDKFNDEDIDRILIPRSPFSKVERVTVNSKGQPNIGKDLMQKIISYRTDNPRLRTALDAFIVSFGLMGANMADLYEAKPFGSEWRYNRRKVVTRRKDRGEMRVEIPEQLRPYIERLSGKGKYQFNVLRSFAYGKDGVSRNVNHHLASWCEEMGVERFTFYAARHTWASLARSCGVDKSTIDDCLAHKGNFGLADIYAEKAWNVINDANRKVLALFDWA